MNYAMIRYILAWVLKVEGAILSLPCIIALMYQEKEGISYLIWMVVCLAIGFLGSVKSRKIQRSIRKMDLRQ